MTGPEMPSQSGGYGVEERYGHRPDLHREDLAHRQVAGAGGRRGKEDDHPQDSLRDRGQDVQVEQVAGRGQQHARDEVAARDHRHPADGIEETPEEPRAEHVPQREREDVVRDAARFYPIELRQDESVGEEDGVVEEGLATHERQTEDGALRVHLEHRLGDDAESYALPLLDDDRPSLDGGSSRPVCWRTCSSIASVVSSASSVRPWVKSQRGL